MAFAHGKDCELAVDQYVMTGIFRSAGFSATVDTAESTVFGLSNKTHAVGQRQAAISMDGFYDEGRQVEVEDRLKAAAPFVATVGPAGLAVGARARLASVVATNVATTSGIGDMTLLNWSLLSTDRVGYGWSLSKPTAVVATTTNGAAVDTGAAVTGALWTAHFHLHQITATNGTLKIQGSADGSTGWTDLTSATSGTLTAAGAVRVTGTGNTLRYVRGVYTATAGVSASYTIAFARIAP